MKPISNDMENSERRVLTLPFVYPTISREMLKRFLCTISYMTILSVSNFAEDIVLVFVVVFKLWNVIEQINYKAALAMVPGRRFDGNRQQNNYINK